MGLVEGGLLRLGQQQIIGQGGIDGEIVHGETETFQVAKIAHTWIADKEQIIGGSEMQYLSAQDQVLLVGSVAGPQQKHDARAIRHGGKIDFDDRPLQLKTGGEGVAANEIRHQARQNRRDGAETQFTIETEVKRAESFQRSRVKCYRHPLRPSMRLSWCPSG